MTRDDEPATWATFAADAPDLAERVRGRFAAHRHHILGTVRPDGSPRLSGTEVAFDDDELTVGMMPESRKLADVRRDARVELHSAPLEEDLAEGDAKVAGTLIANAAPDAGPDGAYFRMAIDLVSLVQVEGDELVLTSWRPGRGLDTVRRK